MIENPNGARPGRPDGTPTKGPEFAVPQDKIEPIKLGLMYSGIEAALNYIEVRGVPGMQFTINAYRDDPNSRFVSSGPIVAAVEQLRIDRVPFPLVTDENSGKLDSHGAPYPRNYSNLIDMHLKSLRRTLTDMNKPPHSWQQVRANIRDVSYPEKQNVIFEYHLNEQKAHSPEENQLYQGNGGEIDFGEKGETSVSVPLIRFLRTEELGRKVRYGDITDFDLCLAAALHYGLDPVTTMEVARHLMEWNIIANKLEEQIELLPIQEGTNARVFPLEQTNEQGLNILIAALVQTVPAILQHRTTGARV